MATVGKRAAGKNPSKMTINELIFKAPITKYYGKSYKINIRLMGVETMNKNEMKIVNKAVGDWIEKRRVLGSSPGLDKTCS